MTFEEFLREIQPGLTLIAALFASLLVFARLFWFFLGYERQLQEENLNKVKDLNLSFRKKNIEKRIEDLISDLKTSGYTWGVNAIVQRIYPSEFDLVTGQQKKTLLPPDQIEELLADIDFKNVREQAVKEADTFAFSDEGQSFFSNMDRLYNKKLKINYQYKRSKFLCRTVSACCLMISILSLLGLAFQSKSTPEVFIHFWIFAFGTAFIIGLVSLFMLLHHRNSLNENWENQLLYGEEQ